MSKSVNTDFQRRYGEVRDLQNGGEDYREEALDRAEALLRDPSTQGFNRIRLCAKVGALCEDWVKASKCYQECLAWWATKRPSSSIEYIEEIEKHWEKLRKHVEELKRRELDGQPILDIDFGFGSVETGDAAAKSLDSSDKKPLVFRLSAQVETSPFNTSSISKTALDPTAAPFADPKQASEQPDSVTQGPFTQGSFTQDSTTSGRARLEILREQLAELKSAGFPENSKFMDIINSINSDMPEDEEFHPFEALPLLMQLEREGSGFGLRVGLSS